MAYIILADIHANLQALESVISSFPEGDNTVMCAGDIVGYGADPDMCAEMIRSFNSEPVMGNHDACVVDKVDITRFNMQAVKAVLWTKEHITGRTREYLETLPLLTEKESFVMVHGTLDDPGSFRYMLEERDAVRTFSILEKQICFVGHSHVPGVFMCKDGQVRQLRKKKFRLENDCRYIINVGSVGQPRDFDNRACYCVYSSDTSEIEIRRVEYDVRTARERIIAAGLPEILGDRLLRGQ